jgi:outer membrane protein assembly factor BamA
MDSFRLRLCLLLLLAFVLTPAAVGGGQEAETPKEAPPQQKVGVVVIPVLFYMPETKWGGGVGGLLTFRSPKSLPQARPSSLYFYMIYTQLKQFEAQFQPEFYFQDEKYILSGTLLWQKYPDKFWGFGPSTPDEAEENYTPLTTALQASYQRKIWPEQKLFIGLQGFLEKYKILEKEAGKSLDSGLWPGCAKGTSVGLGFILNRDTRDNIFSPTRGDYWQLSATLYRKFLGGDFDYTAFKLDLRRFYPVFGTHVLGFQALLQTTGGTPPFKSYPRLGGSDNMRGYYSGRYRDKCLATIQAEYRMPLWWRFGLVGFAGLGNVTDRLGQIKFDSLKFAAGFGIRFKIVPKEGANLRLDFAWGKGTSGFYFTAREAF